MNPYLIVGALVLGLIIAWAVITWRGSGKKEYGLEYSDRFDFYDSSNTSVYQKHHRPDSNNQGNKK